MPEPDELHELRDQLAALRREATAMLREGCTPTQFLKLQRDFVRLWTAVEMRRREGLPARERACRRPSYQ